MRRTDSITKRIFREKNKEAYKNRLIESSSYEDFCELMKQDIANAYNLLVQEVMCRFCGFKFCSINDEGEFCIDSKMINECARAQWESFRDNCE